MLAGLSVMSAFAGDYASAPATGAAIVPNGKFINIYLYPNADTQTWEQHLSILHRAGDPYLTETTTAIDSFTAQLMQSSYFDLLTQYGINPPALLGRARTIKGCVDAAIHDAQAGPTLSYATLRSFAACEAPSAGDPPQVNIFVSPDLDVAGWGAGPSCAGGHQTGFHGWGANVPNFTVIPLNVGCNGSLAAVARTLSHEMVETVSDPAGFGYIHETAIARFAGDVAAEFNEGELGDICENGGPKNPGADPNVAYMAFGAELSVSRYWSNADNDCEPRFIMNRTWLRMTGNPLVRFSSQVQEWRGVPAVAVIDSESMVGQLLLLIRTGGDDLRGGNDNADVEVQFHGRPSYWIRNINRNKHWNNNELHAANLLLPPGTTAGDIAGLVLHTQFGGGGAGDNWNVNEVTVQAALSGGAVRPVGDRIQTVRDHIQR